MIPDEFSPFETDWNQEFVAGWLDGYRASKVAVLNVVRVELRRFGLLVDRDGRVREGCEPESDLQDPQLPCVPDNPDQHFAYEEGWDAGNGEGYQSMIQDLRDQLAPRNLFVTDSGSVTTMDVASELVDYCRDVAESDPPLLSDEAIHAFIDGEPTGLQGQPVAVQVAPPQVAADEAISLPVLERTPDMGLWLWIRGVLNMIRREVDRRVALVAMGSVIVTASVGWLALNDRLEPPRERSQDSQSRGTYIPPTTWNTWPKAAREKFLAWDRLAWQVEGSGGTASLASVISTIMATPGNDAVKCNLAIFVQGSGRTQYAQPLLFGLNPNLSNATARRTIMSSIYRLQRSGLLDPIPQAMGSALLLYQQAQIETDPGAIILLSRLIVSFQNQ